MVGVGVNDVPIVGEPIAYGIGFAVLLFVLLTGELAHVLVTVAHECGHVVAAVVTLRGHRGFKLTDGGGGGTEVIDTSWGPGDFVVTFVGYPFPCLLGLGGAAVVASGNAWGVLWIAIILLLAAFFVSANALATVITLLAVVAVGWSAILGSAYVQVLVAVVLVWWMLIGGAVWSINLSRGDGSDAYWLARRTLVPRIVWHVVWVAIAVVCLIVGGQLLLRPGYDVG